LFYSGKIDTSKGWSFKSMSISEIIEIGAGDISTSGWID